MADRLTVEHYIGKCIEKCAQIILGSRVYQNEDNKPSQDKRSAQWFLLEIEELAGLSVRLDPWRRDIYAPLVIEIYIQPWDTSSVLPPTATADRQDANSSTPPTGVRTLLERWTLGYTAGSSSLPGVTASSRPVVEPAAVYKRLILLIRSLYSYVRVLPAYRMHRACKRHGRELFNTSYTLSTTPLPLTHQQQYGHATAATAGSSNRRMQQFVFSPIETMYGVFEMSVEYQPATTVQLLEQTTLLPCQPRIITDYVDGPYARSAPSDRVMRAHSSSSMETRNNKSDDTGAPAFLRSSQHHAPLVRTSWSSKDIPVVQRGFHPPARSNSLNTTAATAAAATAGASQQQQQQQQQVLSLHRRSLSQGYGSAAGGSPRAPAAAAAAAAAAGVTQHHVTHVGSSGSSNAALAAMQASGVFIGPSSLGKPPLPHSPAAAAVGGGGVSQQHPGSGNASGCSAMLPGNSAAAAAVNLPPASPGTPIGSNSRGVGSVLLRSLSANAAAAASAAAAAAAAAAAGIASSAPGQAGAGLTTAAVHQLSRLGSSFSSSSSPIGSAPRVLGFGVQRQQQQQQQQKQPMDPQATQQGFHVKGGSSSSCFDAASSSGNKQGGGQGLQCTLADQQQQQQHKTDVTDPDLISNDLIMHTAAAAAEGDLTGARNSSAPVPIPGRQKGRARSVTDLQQLMAVDAAAAATQEQQHRQLQQQEAVINSTQPGLQTQQQRQQLSSSSSLLRVRARQQQQQVPVASSAPAAPRGMLGQLLLNSSSTSPSVSPPHDTAAAAGAGASPRAAAAAGQQSVTVAADQAPAAQQEPPAAAAAGRSHAIIIRPQPAQQPYHTAAAAAGASPSPSSRLLQLSHSRTASTGLAAAYSLGAQPVTPGGPNSILSSSPQLPFAFTPSAASLGMSIITFPDQQKHIVQGSSAAAAVAAGRGLARSRSSNAAAAGAGSTAAAAPGSLGTAAAAAPGSSDGSSGVNAVGTPSPPPHVSCVRDITGLATIRRPSWSSRSSSFDVAASASLPRHLSMSPMGDLLDPALLGCSNSSTHNTLSGGHNAFALGGTSVGRGNVGVAAAMPSAAAASGVVMTPAVVLPGGFGSSDQDESAAGAGSSADQAGHDSGSSSNPAAATAAVSGDQVGDVSNTADGSSDLARQDPSASQAGEAAAAAAAGTAADQLLLGSVMPDGESESDILPFAIDAEPYMASGPPAVGSAAAAVVRVTAGHEVHSIRGFQQQQQQQGRGPRFAVPGHVTAAEAAAGGPAAAAATERDVAVGAFVKLIQEASTKQLYRRQQQHQGLSGVADHEQQQQQQQQPLLVADALEQVQQMAAQLQMLVFPNGE